MSIPAAYIDLWQKIQISSQKFEEQLSPVYRKQTGSYYTSLDLALSMMQELLNSFSPLDRKKMFLKKFLEPCVGTGHFVFAYIIASLKLNFTKEEYRLLLENIYVCDINIKALSLYKKNLHLLVQELFNIDLDENYFKEHVRGGLLFDVSNPLLKYIPLSKRFSRTTIGNGFDIVVTNPPYKNLKAERMYYKQEKEYISDKECYETIGKLAKNNFQYSLEGTLNLYKLFVEEIIERYIAPSGRCYLLIPSSILSDKTCFNLRGRILKQCGISALRLIPEKTGMVNASQALCALLLCKGKPSSIINLQYYISKKQKISVQIPFKEMIDVSSGNAICVLSENESKIRLQMLQHPTIKNLKYIHNLRGELDLSLHKKYICSSPTGYPLVRGRALTCYKLQKSLITEFVQASFLQKTSKARYVNQERIACQQIANMTKEQRIQFSPIPSRYILGNSCNFISVSSNTDGVNLYFLLGILNSSLINWYFKKTSSNNHVNNYEIDNFPIPVHCSNKKEIEELVKIYLKNPTEELRKKIDSSVYQAYGISDSCKKSNGNLSRKGKGLVQVFQSDLSKIIPDISLEACYDILENKASITDVIFQEKIQGSVFDKQVLVNIENKYKKLYQGYLLNHTTFKLSSLDLEMIRNVPQGGNWKDIPLETVRKSKRLLRLTQTGGRTTLYGRIDYNKPSYTITTYFNRPGNGTYVHPTLERVLSVREAARFQSFPDNYYFSGNKTEMLKQVGNAVPVFLAYAIAKNIILKTGCSVSVDLFSGAGGMTYGFKQAGIKSSVCNDIDMSACVTLKTNSPDLSVVCGDITSKEIKERIITDGLRARADIICGGPPCQGFSLAGLRNKNDVRNQLFQPFVDIVSAINPKVIVFENVEGLLSFQKGATYSNIITLFSQLGYWVEGRTLFANYFAVPQKRKRVIIICVRKDVGVSPADLYPEEITKQEKLQITARDTIRDLENIECGEAARYHSSTSSVILPYFRGELSIDEFLQNIALQQNY